MKNNGFNGFNFDWTNFQKQLLGHLNRGEGFLPKGGNMPDFGQFVNDLISQHIPQPVSGISPYSSKSTNTEVYDTHNFMITRIPLSPDVNIEHVKIYLKSNQVKISGLTNGQAHFINLPSKSKLVGSRAIYKDGVLELRILKDKDDDFQEIKISY